MKELIDEVQSLEGKKIKKINLTNYIGSLRIESIEFEDGTMLELSGNCDYCTVDEVIQS